MVGTNNDRFSKRINTFEDMPVIPSTSSYIGDFYISKNEGCKISKDETLQSKSCCYNKLSFMDSELKIMHKKWSMID